MGILWSKKRLGQVVPFCRLFVQGCRLVVFAEMAWNKFGSTKEGLFAALKVARLRCNPVQCLVGSFSLLPKPFSTTAVALKPLFASTATLSAGKTVTTGVAERIKLRPYPGDTSSAPQRRSTGLVVARISAAPLDALRYLQAFHLRRYHSTERDVFISMSNAARMALWF